MLSPRHKAGSALPFRELFRNHAAFVWRVLLRYGVQTRDVEDMCQEVFVVVHRRLAEFEGRANVRSWIYEIARRTALAQRRKTQQRGEILDAPEHALEAAQAGPEEQAAQREALAWLTRALQQLDEDKREAFVLYELEEMTLSEVAEAVGSPINTVHYRITSAREALKTSSLRQENAARSALPLLSKLKELP